MNLIWPQSAFYSPPTVLGKTLQGFSPFHALMLSAVESPYIEGGKPGFDDTLLAVHICSHGWADRFEVQGNPDAVKAWGKKAKIEDIGAAPKLIEQYFAESWKTPRFWNSGDGHVRSNWVFLLVTFAICELGMTEEQAWDTPIARLMCYRASWGEMQGDKSLMSDEEAAAIESDRENSATGSEQ